ncbi:MAG: tetratricopeptide repeat protein [Oligosphaeraceae bacterium]
MSSSLSSRSCLALVALCLMGFVSLAHGGIDTSLLNRAKMGDPEAQFQVGRAYLNGDGVQQDADEGLAWLILAMENGHVEARALLANMGIALVKQCEYGLGIPLLRKAADQGNTEAMLWLGLCAMNGWGLNMADPELAVSWYQKAALCGNATAQYKMGCCYERGTGVRKNLTEAATWYREAALLGLVEAQLALGKCYAYGLGVQEDKEEALQWLNEVFASGEEKYKREAVEVIWAKRW